ncbi:MAG: deiodinase-like protein [Acidobacteriota bacterium]
MGFRSQFEGLTQLAERWRFAADFYMVYSREAFPAESPWPAPVPDAQPVESPETLEERFQLVERFKESFGSPLPFLVDGLDDRMVADYDAYPFRLYALTPEGQVAVTSDKGAAGFKATLGRVDAWLGGRFDRPESLDR